MCFFIVQVIAEAVRTTLGPRGMDKLIVDGRGGDRREFRDEFSGSRRKFTPNLVVLIQVRAPSPTMEPPS